MDRRRRRPRGTPDGYEAAAAWRALTVPSLIASLLAAGIVLVPPLLLVGLVTWTRRLRKLGAPRFAVWVAFALAIVAGLVVVAGYIGAAVVVTRR